MIVPVFVYDLFRQFILQFVDLFLVLLVVVFGFFNAGTFSEMSSVLDHRLVVDHSTLARGRSILIVPVVTLVSSLTTEPIKVGQNYTPGH